MITYLLTNCGDDRGGGGSAESLSEWLSRFIDLAEWTQRPLCFALL